MGMPSGNSAEIIQALRGCLGRPGLLITDRDLVEAACGDYRGWYRGDAIGIARPRTADEVREVVRCAANLNCAIVPQGGNTSMCGGAVPATGGDRPTLILATSGLNAIRSLEASSWSVTVEAGCTVGQVQDAAKSVGRHFGLDFGARGTATIGGALSTNAGGMNVVRYGNCRDLVLGLEAVLSNGSLWSNLKTLRKDNSGLDLRHLLVGAEGVLGIITAASLKLHAAEVTSATALLQVTSIEAASKLAELAMGMADGALSAIELLPAMGIRRACKQLLHCRTPMDLSEDWYVLCRLAGAEPVQDRMHAIVARAMEESLCSDAIAAQSSVQEAQLWSIRDSFSDLHKHLGFSFRFDYAVPLGKVPELYHRLCKVIGQIEPNFTPFAFGHLGDGNLHFSACQPPSGDRAHFEARRGEIEAAANAVVWDLRGTVSAEHGIGQLHRDELSHQKSPTELSIMRKIKAALDPLGLMNSGKLVPDQQCEVAD